MWKNILGVAFVAVVIVSIIAFIAALILIFVLVVAMIYTPSATDNYSVGRVEIRDIPAATDGIRVDKELKLDGWTLIPGEHSLEISYESGPDSLRFIFKCLPTCTLEGRKTANPISLLTEYPKGTFMHASVLHGSNVYSRIILWFDQGTYYVYQVGN